jgi:DNA-binding MarR family transcriptional regulator
MQIHTTSAYAPGFLPQLVALGKMAKSMLDQGMSKSSPLRGTRFLIALYLDRRDWQPKGPSRLTGVSTTELSSAMMCSAAMISAPLRAMLAQQLVSSRKPRAQVEGSVRPVDRRQRLYALSAEGKRQLKLRLRQIEDLEEALGCLVSRKLEDELLALHRCLQTASLDGHLRSIKALELAVRQGKVRTVRRGLNHVLGRTRRMPFAALEPWERI